MAYPFVQAPMFSELVENLCANFGCEKLTLPRILRGPRGDVDIEYLRRVVDGEELFSEPLPSDQSERVSPDSLRRVIVQLKLPVQGVWIWAGNPYCLDDH